MRSDYIWEDCPRPAIDPKSARQREMAKSILQNWIEEMEESGYVLVMYDSEVRAGLFKDVK